MGVKRKRSVISVRVKCLTGRTLNVDVDPKANAFCGGCYPRGLCPYLDGGTGMLKVFHRLEEKYKWDTGFTINLLNEYFKFMKLKWKKQDFGCSKGLSPPPSIDMVWCEHLLDTYEYQDFCKIVGESCDWSGTSQFIHRTPQNLGSADGAKEVYEEEFGVKPDDTYWGEFFEPPPQVLPTYTCTCLAVKIMEQEGMPVAQIRLVYDHTRLENGSLESYGIQDGALVHLVLRLGGC